ncbi:hypothetical protein O6H91_11G101900 [Diphasiastrum complanatum]|nr:hypothetical protein O6H91_11G101900 [Diphasiastrum complanatum]KAJ7539620.1 hypothetical protein O6H91_11G101900 [Diphasiastrum complanatum]
MNSDALFTCGEFVEHSCPDMDDINKQNFRLQSYLNSIVAPSLLAEHRQISYPLTSDVYSEDTIAKLESRNTRTMFYPYFAAVRKRTAEFSSLPEHFQTQQAGNVEVAPGHSNTLGDSAGTLSISEAAFGCSEDLHTDYKELEHNSSIDLSTAKSTYITEPVLCVADAHRSYNDQKTAEFCVSNPTLSVQRERNFCRSTELESPEVSLLAANKSKEKRRKQLSKLSSPKECNRLQYSRERSVKRQKLQNLHDNVFMVSMPSDLNLDLHCQSQSRADGPKISETEHRFGIADLIKAAGLHFVEDQKISDPIMKEENPPDLKDLDNFTNSGKKTMSLLRNDPIIESLEENTVQQFCGDFNLNRMTFGDSPADTLLEMIVAADDGLEASSKYNQHEFEIENSLIISETSNQRGIIKDHVLREQKIFPTESSGSSNMFNLDKDRELCYAGSCQEVGSSLENIHIREDLSDLECNAGIIVNLPSQVIDSYANLYTTGDFRSSVDAFEINSGHALLDSIQAKRTLRSTPKAGTNVVRGQWTPEEDRYLVELVNRFSPQKWSLIAANLPGRIGKQCRERWNNHLRPDIKRDVWKPDEERLLVSAHNRLGNKWADISKLIPGRTENAIKNHFHATVRRKNIRRKHRKVMEGSTENTESTPRSTVLRDYVQMIYPQGEGKSMKINRQNPVTLAHASPQTRHTNDYKSPTLDFNLDVGMGPISNCGKAKNSGYQLDTELFAGMHNEEVDELLDKMMKAGQDGSETETTPYEFQEAGFTMQPLLTFGQLPCHENVSRYLSWDRSEKANPIYPKTMSNSVYGWNNGQILGSIASHHLKDNATLTSSSNLQFPWSVQIQANMDAGNNSEPLLFCLNNLTNKIGLDSNPVSAITSKVDRRKVALEATQYLPDITFLPEEALDSRRLPLPVLQEIKLCHQLDMKFLQDEMSNIEKDSLISSENDKLDALSLGAPLNCLSDYFVIDSDYIPKRESSTSETSECGYTPTKGSSDLEQMRNHISAMATKPSDRCMDNYLTSAKTESSYCMKSTSTHENAFDASLGGGMPPCRFSEIAEAQGMTTENRNDFPELLLEEISVNDVSNICDQSKILRQSKCPITLYEWQAGMTSNIDRPDISQELDLIELVTRQLDTEDLLFQII